MMWLLLFVVAFFVIGILSYFRKIYRLRQCQAMFRRYHESGDVAVIVSWIEAKDTPARLADIMDYLLKIDNEDLALQVYRAFDKDRLRGRHIRIFACRAFRKQGERQDALELARDLWESYPGDDAIFELLLETHLAFGEIEPIRELLAERMKRKFKGTIFHRFHAQILAADGKMDLAIQILEKIVKQEEALYSNTFAQPQKKLIYDQYMVSAGLLESFKNRDGKRG